MGLSRFGKTGTALLSKIKKLCEFAKRNCLTDLNLRSEAEVARTFNLSERQHDIHFCKFLLIKSPIIFLIFLTLSPIIKCFNNFLDFIAGGLISYCIVKFKVRRSGEEAFRNVVSSFPAC